MKLCSCITSPDGKTVDASQAKEAEGGIFIMDSKISAY